MQSTTRHWSDSLAPPCPRTSLYLLPPWHLPQSRNRKLSPRRPGLMACTLRQRITIRRIRKCRLLLRLPLQSLCHQPQLTRRLPRLRRLQLMLRQRMAHLLRLLRLQLMLRQVMVLLPRTAAHPQSISQRYIPNRPLIHLQHMATRSQRPHTVYLPRRLRPLSPHHLRLLRRITSPLLRQRLLQLLLRQPWLLRHRSLRLRV